MILFDFFYNFTSGQDDSLNNHLFVVSTKYFNFQIEHRNISSRVRVKIGII